VGREVAGIAVKRKKITAVRREKPKWCSTMMAGQGKRWAFENLKKKKSIEKRENSGFLTSLIEIQQKEKERQGNKKKTNLVKVLRKEDQNDPIEGGKWTKRNGGTEERFAG